MVRLTDRARNDLKCVEGAVKQKSNQTKTSTLRPKLWNLVKNAWVLENLPRFRGSTPNPTPLHEFAQFLGCETSLPHPAKSCLCMNLPRFGVCDALPHSQPCLRTCIPFTHFSLRPSLKTLGVPTPLWVRPCLHYDLIFIDAVSYGMKPDGRRANHSRKIMTLS